MPEDRTRAAEIAALHSERAAELQRIKGRLAGLGEGRRYWRSLEELAETPEFLEMLHREFPRGASEWTDPVSRRQFLTLMGASLALAGLSGCVKGPKENIYPYVRQPEQIIPGKPLFFASAMTFLGYAEPLLVESHMGRPTKIEGNPDHGSSLGATSLYAQASILSMYDPDRPRTITHMGEIRPWSQFSAEMAPILEEQRKQQGAGMRLLTQTVTSPSLSAAIGRLLAVYPQAKWVQYEPAGRDSAREGARRAFGETVDTVYRFEDADVVLSLDADFMVCGPGAVRYARDFAARRKVRGPDASMNRLYMVEPMPSSTGSLADHRIAMRACDIGAFARAVAAGIGVAGVEAPATLTPRQRRQAQIIAKDLEASKGRSLVIAGEWQPAEVHALAHAMNAVLGNAGKTVVYVPSAEARPVNQLAAIKELADEMEQGQVQLLVVAGCNPAYDAPADLEFARRMEKVGVRIHLGLLADETAALCQWQIPECHFLESWGDARAHDGTVTLTQPLIAPLFGSKTLIELVALLAGEGAKSNYDLVRDHWKAELNRPDFDAFWAKCIHDGFIPDTASQPKEVTVTTDPAAFAPASAEADGLEVVLRPDPTVFDGRFANNGWLQEVPKPFSKVTWDNTALMSPATAKRLGVQDEDVVEIAAAGRKVVLPVCVQPGHADDSITVHLGFGRTRAGKVGNKVGVDAYVLRTSAAPWVLTGASVRKTGRRYALARTQMHWNMEGRNLVRHTDLEHFRKEPDFVKKYDYIPPASITPGHEYPENSWGMVVDLGVCNGCNACVVACNAENNIAIVGKDQVRRGREMHWIRIDQYYEGDPDAPALHTQPVACQHCENAPCEVVCPVAATVHGDEGTNDMVYNRCVGTRFCANNCPYKVRRFNFFQYQDYTTDLLKMARNPDVTVRSRGVIEKCSFCIQRLNSARIDSKLEGRPIRDGEVKTACQAACPPQAIIFGNINDPESEVAKAKALSHNYALLTEYNTKPRLTYLASVRNPNPEFGEA
jgi:MoCo/4Fe-4S cofactor protein with predicted Tat translocation signal